MNLPQVIQDLLKAQDKFDSAAYANCFSTNAIVYDEGRNHIGRTEIQYWNNSTNENYKTVIKPLSYAQNGTKAVLTAENAGTFPGSPIVLQFHFEIVNGLIESLKITG